MNTIEIGRYIRFRRNGMNLTQKELAKKLNISFQAISKWETGVTLPDTSLLLSLSDELEVSVDQILNAGEFRQRMNKKIVIEEIIHSLSSILNVKNVLGPNSIVYKGMISGINKDGEIDFEEMIKNPDKMEIIVARACIQLIIDGYSLNDDDVLKNFKNVEIQEKLIKYAKKYSQS